MKKRFKQKTKTVQQNKVTWAKIFEYGQAVGKKMGIQSEENVLKAIKEVRNEK
jgi:hypothetical protein